MIIIDGNNLIHKIPELKKLFAKDKTAAQVSLIEIIKTRINKKEKVTFVFDGHNNFKKAGIIFSGDITADEIIRKKIEQASSPTKLKVISSNTGITHLAKVCGCNVQRSEDFWGEINRIESISGKKNINQNYIYDKLEKPERMNKREIDEFRKYFS